MPKTRILRCDYKILANHFKVILMKITGGSQILAAEKGNNPPSLDKGLVSVIIAKFISIIPEGCRSSKKNTSHVIECIWIWS